MGRDEGGPLDGVAERVILIGMMGSGKTTIGRLLSKSTGWPYVDNDDLVRRLTGRTSRQVLAELGKERMRTVERDALALGVGLPPPAIIGVAAGTILDPTSRRRLRDGGTVVWLRADPAILEARSASSEHRPFVDTEDPGWMARAAREREPLYAEVADLVIETDEVTPTHAVAIIREHLGAA